MVGLEPWLGNRSAYSALVESHPCHGKGDLGRMDGHPHNFCANYGATQNQEGQNYCILQLKMLANCKIQQEDHLQSFACSCLCFHCRRVHINESSENSVTTKTDSSFGWVIRLWKIIHFYLIVLQGQVKIKMLNFNMDSLFLGKMKKTCQFSIASKPIFMNFCLGCRYEGYQIRSQAGQVIKNLGIEPSLPLHDSRGILQLRAGANGANVKVSGACLALIVSGITAVIELLSATSHWHLGFTGHPGCKSVTTGILKILKKDSGSPTFSPTFMKYRIIWHLFFHPGW